jgi:hypothetical protein
MTKKVVEHHVESLIRLNVEEILTGYTEESILFTPSGPVQGLSGLKQVFEAFFQAMPEGLIENLEFIRKDYVKDTAYLLWKSGENAPLGTDTFFVKDGKILVQTFAAYLI